jgi:short-subunit dehydrogenase
LVRKKIMDEKISPSKKLTALITGASSGLGEAIAKNCAGRGFDLILVSENKKELGRVHNEIKRHHSCSVISVTADLIRKDSAGKLFNFCKKRKLSVDILVNCAGIYATIEREMREIKCIDDILHLHILTFTELCFFFGKTMIRRERGFIMNISSIASRFPDPASLTYGPTKRFILSLSVALHCEWKRHNVRVTCLTPGSIRTNFFKANDVFVPSIIKSTFISPERCAEIGLDALFKGRAVVTPGITGKLQSFFLRIISRPLTYDLIRKSYFSMKNKKPRG